MVNKVILVGNTGQDPDVRHLEGGVAVANFNLATSETYKNKNGEKVTQTEWHRVVLWRGLAEIAEKFVKKGQLLYIEGRLRTRSWEDKEGVKRYTTEVFADVMRMLGKKGEEGYSQESSSEKQEEPDLSREQEDDLPF